MRKLSYVITAAMLFSAGTLLANPKIDRGPEVGLSDQISEMLSDNSFSDSAQDLVAQVRFTLNDDGEIVVLSVETNSDTLENFIKSRLNYHKVKVSNVKEGKLYTVPVRIAS